MIVNKNFVGYVVYQQIDDPFNIEGYLPNELFEGCGLYSHHYTHYSDYILKFKLFRCGVKNIKSFLKRRCFYGELTLCPIFKDINGRYYMRDDDDKDIYI
jgi:hypothetical protein